MDDQRVGRVVRALRRRRGWRQSDLAAAAGCSQRTVSDIERGHLASVPTLRKVLAAVDGSLVLDVRWRAGALDRLMDEEHATLVGAVTSILSRAGWDARVEVTYSVYGERGSIDIVAFHPKSGVLLVIEVKTDLPSIESTIRKIDEKVRLGPALVRERFGWHAHAVGRLIVMPETTTLRRRLQRHAAILDRAFPVRGAAIRRWLRSPGGAVSGIWLLSSSNGRATTRGHGGANRVRRPKGLPLSVEIAA